LKRSVEMVNHARSYVDDVEFSPMDATRTDISYLHDVVEAVIGAGANTVNIPDTVGYATPEEFGALIRGIKERVSNINTAVISVHCHNDLGLAVANVLSAIRNGAEQVECTVNGIGERAGNCSMEEVVMALRTRKDFFDADSRVNSEEIIRTSRLVTKITGIPVQPNKAIVGANAFAHESGIHQDGLLKERTTYEIMRPESIGLVKTNLVLGKHSGRHAFRDRLKQMGYDLSDEDVNKAFERFKHVADQKKEVFDEDLEAIVSDEMQQIQEVYMLLHLSAQSGTDLKPTATVEMKVNGKTVKQTGTGDGPVDAVYRTIALMTGTKSILDAYLVKGITGGTDALGEVTVKIEEEGKKIAGHGADTDIIVASAKAYVNALNKLEYWKKGRPKSS
jgi:2-isopropylmalate synthase